MNRYEKMLAKLKRNPFVEANEMGMWFVDLLVLCDEGYAEMLPRTCEVARFVVTTAGRLATEVIRTKEPA